MPNHKSKDNDNVDIEEQLHLLNSQLEKCCMDKEHRYELNLLCEQSDPDLHKIKERVLKNPRLLYPFYHGRLCSTSGNENGPRTTAASEHSFMFPLYKAVITPRTNTQKDSELIQFLIEQALLVHRPDNPLIFPHSKDLNGFEKGGLLCKGSPDLYPLIALGYRNKFHVLEYLANRDPPILDHDDIANVFFKCFYLFDNPGAIPHLLNIFPTFLREDMSDEIPVLKRFVVHSARTSQDVTIFQTVVEIGLRQNSDLDRGVITGDVIQTLVTRKYIVGLNYLRDHDPPLLRPEDVVELDLFACLVNSSWAQFTYSADVFHLLLELDPSSIKVRTKTNFNDGGDGSCHYLPIHIFCEFLMDHIHSDEQFYRLLGMVLELGMEYRVGDKNNDGAMVANGYGGIFEPCNGTIPAKHLHRYIGRMGRADDNDGDEIDDNSATSNRSRGSILEAALLCETEVDWIHNTLIPNILEDMEPGSIRVVNNEGRLPLHYCIATPSMSLCCVLKILELDESTIDLIDPMTGLIPSLLTASAPVGYYRIYPTAQLDVIFELMRRYPMLSSVHI